MSTIVVAGRIGQIRDRQANTYGERIRFSVAEQVGKDATLWWECSVEDERLMGLLEQYFTSGKPIIVSGTFKGARLYDKRNGGGQGLSHDLRVSMIEFAPGGAKRDGEAPQGSSHAAQAHDPGPDVDDPFADE